MTTVFGWCLDGSHSGCRLAFEFNNSTVTCTCECHRKDNDVSRKGNTVTTDSSKPTSKRASRSSTKTTTARKTKPRTVTNSTK